MAVLQDMMAAAAAGAPVYISKVQGFFESLPEARCDALVLRIDELAGNDTRVQSIKIPTLASCGPAEKVFVEDYVCAQLYNILAVAGACSITVFMDTSSDALAQLAAKLSQNFCPLAAPEGQGGYGRAVKVLNRMLAALRPGQGPFRLSVAPPAGQSGRPAAAGAAPPAAPGAAQSAAPSAAAGAAPPVAPVAAQGAAPSAAAGTTFREGAYLAAPGAAQSAAPSAAAGAAFREGASLAAPVTAQGAAPSAAAGAAFREGARNLDNKYLCGIDIGGTDIKAVLVCDSQIIAYKEYDWAPASFARAGELVDPICLIVQVLQARLWLEYAPLPDMRRKALLLHVQKALGKKAGALEMEEALSVCRAAGLDMSLRFDGIGLCFPDVVIKNKIVGGETPKTGGIRANRSIDYEAEFAEITNLDVRLSAWVKPAGAVRIINDGSMAAFTAAVEMASASSLQSSQIEHGVFAHTLGTDLGSGWVREDGSIPDIPLELYNLIIDLGSWPERRYEAEDVRSINNINNGLPGTVQKYCGQHGVFRLAMKYFPTERPDLFLELKARGYIVQKPATGAQAVPFAATASSGWYVPSSPVDQRKAFLEYMMDLPDREKDESCRKIWREIGECLAVSLLETKRILHPATDERFLFGRLVKNKTCFDLIVEGARRIKPDSVFTVADSTMAYTSLMRQLAANPDYTVAQFGQAIGAVYFANSQ